MYTGFFQLKKVTVCGLGIYEYSIHRKVSRFKGTLNFNLRFNQTIHKIICVIRNNKNKNMLCKEF